MKVMCSDSSIANPSGRLAEIMKDVRDLHQWSIGFVIKNTRMNEV